MWIILQFHPETQNHATKGCLAGTFVSVFITYCTRARVGELTRGIEKSNETASADTDKGNCSLVEYRWWNQQQQSHQRLCNLHASLIWENRCIIRIVHVYMYTMHSWMRPESGDVKSNCCGIALPIHCNTRVLRIGNNSVVTRVCTPLRSPDADADATRIVNSNHTEALA